MSDASPRLVPTTRPLDAHLLETVKSLKPGQKIRLTQTVRVGFRTWTTEVIGTFRSVRSLVTGLATERKLVDDIIVPTIHFTKENGELSSVTLDSQSKLEVLN